MLQIEGWTEFSELIELSAFPTGACVGGRGLCCVLASITRKVRKHSTWRQLWELGGRQEKLRLSLKVLKRSVISATTTKDSWLPFVDRVYRHEWSDTGWPCHAASHGGTRPSSATNRARRFRAVYYFCSSLPLCMFPGGKHDPYGGIRWRFWELCLHALSQVTWHHLWHLKRSVFSWSDGWIQWIDSCPLTYLLESLEYTLANKGQRRLAPAEPVTSGISNLVNFTCTVQKLKFHLSKYEDALKWTYTVSDHVNVGTMVMTIEAWLPSWKAKGVSCGACIPLKCRIKWVI